MLIDLYRILRIVLKFVFYDFWLLLYRALIGKQNPAIKSAYERRVASAKRRRI